MRLIRISLVAFTVLVVVPQSSGQGLEWAPTNLADTSLHVRSLFVSVDGTVFAGTNLGVLRRFLDLSRLELDSNEEY